MRRTRRWAAVALVALSAAGFAGCGSDDDGDTNAGDDTTETTAEGGEAGTAEISVAFKDYAYDVSGPLTASENATIAFSNEGKEFHMAAGGRLKDGKTLADVTEMLSSGGPGGGEGEEGGEGGEAEGGEAAEDTTTTAGAPAGEDGEGEGGEGGEEGGDPFEELFESDTFFPGTFLSPGESSKMTVSIENAGEYVMLCFIPTEGEGAPHFTKGMVGSFIVTDEGEAGEAPTPTAEYTVEDGKTEGPETLKAGRNVLKVTVAEGHQPGMARMKPGETLQSLDAFFSGVFESEEPPAKGIADTAPGAIVAFLDSEVEEETVLYFEVELEAGEYVFGCVATEGDDDEDPANDVKHSDKEFVTIKVA